MTPIIFDYADINRRMNCHPEPITTSKEKLDFAWDLWREADDYHEKAATHHMGQDDRQEYIPVAH